MHEQALLQPATFGVDVASGESTSAFVKIEVNSKEAYAIEHDGLLGSDLYMDEDNIKLYDSLIAEGFTPQHAKETMTMVGSPPEILWKGTISFIESVKIHSSDAAPTWYQRGLKKKLPYYHHRKRF